MNAFLKKNFQRILLLFLFLQPLLDCFTSVMLNIFHWDFTIGIIVRMLFLGFLAYLYFFIYGEKEKRKYWTILGVLVLYLLCFGGQVMISKGTGAIFYEEKNLFRAFYFPLALFFLYRLDHEEKIVIPTKFLFQIVCIYLALILLPVLTNTSFNGYTQGKVGVIGWFNSINEISAILSILLPIFLYEWANLKNHWLQGIILLGLCYVVFQLGSKIVIASFLVAIFVNFILWYQRKDRSTRKKVWKYGSPLLIIAVIATLLFLPKTSFYKNIKVHAEFLEIDQVTDLFQPEMINRFIFSDRLTFLQETHTSYIAASLSERWLGIGYIENYGTDQVSTKMIEMDPFDLFYRHGIFGTIAYLLPIIVIFFSLRKKSEKKRRETPLIWTSLLLSLGLACLSGHVWLAPAVSIYVAIVMFVTVKPIQSKK